MKTSIHELKKITTVLKEILERPPYTIGLTVSRELWNQLNQIKESSSMVSSIIKSVGLRVDVTDFYKPHQWMETLSNGTIRSHGFSEAVDNLVNKNCPVTCNKLKRND